MVGFSGPTCRYFSKKFNLLTGGCCKKNYSTTFENFLINKIIIVLDVLMIISNAALSRFSKKMEIPSIYATVARMGLREGIHRTRAQV